MMLFSLPLSCHQSLADHLRKGKIRVLETGAQLYPLLLCMLVFHCWSVSQGQNPAMSSRSILSTI